MPRLALLTALMSALFTMCVACRSTQTLPPVPDDDGLRGAYADSAYLAPFSFHNHYYDGWRAYEETISAARFINGVGAVMPPPSRGYPPEEVARMLAEHGVTRGRLEVPWGELSMDENSEDLAEFDATLLAMRKHGIRPIILLNAHHGGPAPRLHTQHTVTADAAQGDRTITINDASGLNPHYSGPQLDDHAPSMFIIEIDGDQLTLSKPLPEALSTGQGVDFVTLKYRPFSKPGIREQQETVAGWRIREPQDSPRPLGLVWVDCPRSVVSTGLVRALEKKARVHQGPKPPGDIPSCVILCANSHEGLSERVGFHRELSLDAPPIVVFGPQLDLPLARDVLQAGASGFVHAEMTPDQLVRAVAVAARGSSSRHASCFGMC